MFELIVKVLSIIAPIVIIAAAGYAYAQKKNPDMSSINALAVDIVVPMLIFSGMASKSFSIIDSRWFIFSAFLVIIGAGLYSYVISRLHKIDPKTMVPPMMFNNSAFVGLPLVVMALGPERLGAGVAIYVVMTIIQMSWGMHYITGTAKWGQILKNPMLIACAMGLIVNVTNVDIGPWLMSAVDIMGKAAIPLMLLSLGARMTQIDFKAWRLGLLGAWISPVSSMLIALPLVYFMPLSVVEQSHLLLFAALPPAIANYIVAEKAGHSPGEVATIVLFGNLGSVIFLPIALIFVMGR